MTPTIYLLRRTLSTGGILFLVGCVYGGGGSPSVSLPTNAASQATSPTVTQQSKSDETERGAALRKALQHSAKEAEDRAHGVPLPPSAFPLPNPDAGPHRPPPSYVNIYNINDDYPNYLRCKYDVDEKNYNQSKEQEWFKKSLKQIRYLGQEKFPTTIKWIAVLIKNRAEHKDASTFEQSFKVGAIFKANDVFDSSKDLSQMIAAAAMDRHPFKYEPQNELQQRWIIVERHAATNHPAASSP